MRFLKITKYSDVDEIAYISILGSTIDFRDWYIIKRDDYWSESWYDNFELKEILKDNKNIEYKKLSKFHTMINLDYKFKKFIKNIFIFSLGVIVGMIIKGFKNV